MPAATADALVVRAAAAATRGDDRGSRQLADAARALLRLASAAGGGDGQHPHHLAAAAVALMAEAADADRKPDRGGSGSRGKSDTMFPRASAAADALVAICATLNISAESGALSSRRRGLLQALYGASKHLPWASLITPANVLQHAWEIIAYAPVPTSEPDGDGAVP